MEQQQTNAIEVPVFGQSTTSEANLRFDADKKHSFVGKYNPKATEIVGYRQAVIRYRVTGTNKVEKPAMAVTIPQVSLPDSDYLLPDAAKQVLIGVIEDQQDAIIRDLLDQKPVPAVIDWDAVSLDKSLAALTATRVSSRLTKEMIETWCKFQNGGVYPMLAARGKEIAAKKGLDEVETMKQTAGTVNAYSERFGRLAAAVPNLGEDEARSLQAMLAKCNVDDDISKALAKKLHAILNPAQASDDL